ncbi:MAG: Mth938-like domain-containing protein [Alphaproteobacteria bacterium]
MTDDTDPLAPERLFIDGYGGGGFRVAGEFRAGSLLILSDRALAWAVKDFAEATAESLAPVLEHDSLELLLIGTGSRMQMVPQPLRDACRDVGITVEPMDTGAAARTYNVLLAEDRRVGAALVAL